MCLVVYLGQMLEIKVRIDLRRGYIGMAQELLDTPQIMTGFEQMCCEGMPEQMRVNVRVDALFPSPVADSGLD